MSMQKCLDAGFTENQCHFLLPRKRFPTRPVVTESIDDFLHGPMANNFVHTLKEANKDNIMPAIGNVSLGRIHCTPIDDDMYVCSM